MNKNNELSDSVEEKMLSDYIKIDENKYKIYPLDINYWKNFCISEDKNNCFYNNQNVSVIKNSNSNENSDEFIIIKRNNSIKNTNLKLENNFSKDKNFLKDKIDHSKNLTLFNSEQKVNRKKKLFDLLRSGEKIKKFNYE